MLKPQLEDELEYSYSQFIVFDRSVANLGMEWTDSHVGQGFARTASAVSFGTFEEYGAALLRVYVAPFPIGDRSVRVLQVPFEVTSGEVRIEGVEEYEKRSVILEAGHYSLTAALSPLEGDEGEPDLQIDLCFERRDEPLRKSSVMRCDPALEPPSVLVEDASLVEQISVEDL